jgi:predicted Zn-dependent protease
MEGATGVTQGAVNNQRADLRVVLIRYDADTVYQFMFATPPGSEGKYDRPFRETTYSFRKLSAAEASQAKPQRIKVVTVGANDSVTSLAQRMNVDDLAEERFRVLNGLAEGHGRLQPGDKVKIVQ